MLRIDKLKWRIHSPGNVYEEENKVMCTREKFCMLFRTKQCGWSTIEEEANKENRRDILSYKEDSNTA